MPETVLVWEERCREAVGPRPQRERCERSKGDRPADVGSRPERSSRRIRQRTDSALGQIEICSKFGVKLTKNSVTLQTSPLRLPFTMRDSVWTCTLWIRS